eukprot:639728-Amphidinium_carterae.1
MVGMTWTLRWRIPFPHQNQNCNQKRITSETEDHINSFIFFKLGHKNLNHGRIGRGVLRCAPSKLGVTLESASCGTGLHCAWTACPKICRWPTGSECGAQSCLALLWGSSDLESFLWRFLMLHCAKSNGQQHRSSTTQSHHSRKQDRFCLLWSTDQNEQHGKN